MGRDLTFSKISTIGSIGLLLLAPFYAVAYLRDEGYDEGGAID